MRSRLSTLVAVALLATASFAAPARAGEACVPPAVTAALADCSDAASLPAMSFASLLNAGSAAPPAAWTALKKVPAGSALAPRPLDASESALAGAYRRFACEDRPAAGDTAARDRHLEIAYRRGRLYLGANRIQEAAAIFREIAMSGAETAVSAYAAQLYLKSIHVLGSQGAAACYDDMTRDVPVLLGLHCKGGREKANAGACVLLDRVQRDIERLTAEREVRAAEHLPREPAMDRYRAGAERYMEIWRRHGEAPCAAMEPGCEQMEEVLYNAALAFQAARDIPKAIAVRQILMDPTYHLQSTDLARRAPYEIGGIYQALADYEQAATWYERYARESPQSDKSPDALSDAIVLRLALGQEADAIEDSERFNRSYGSSKPEQTARIAFVVGAHEIEKEDWAAARKQLSSAMSLIDRNAALDVQIQAHAMLGRVSARLDTAASAATEYEKVRGIWKDPAAVVKKIQETGDDRRLAKALTALGEALFFFAEEKRKVAEAIRLPAYTGTGRHEDIVEHLAAKVAPAMTARRKAVEDAEKAYREVLEIQPVPPPRWVVAAAERVARMRGLLAAELRALPAPQSWKRTGRSPWGSRWEDVRSLWRDALLDASEPDHLAARAAYRRCLELSLTMQSSDDHSRHCAAWLERNFPAEYPRLDEIAPRPSRLPSGLQEHEEPEPDRRRGTVRSRNPP
jgi:tetratricopeptide (TPR) repeat protein